MREPGTSRESIDTAPYRPYSDNSALRGSRRQQLSRLRDVILVLVSRQFKGRYKNTVVGVAWSLISPLLYLLVFYVVFKVALAITAPFYATFVFTGLLAWIWVQSALNDSVNSITSNAALVSQPGFPSVTLPLVAVATQLVNFLIGLPILFLIAWIEGTAINGLLVLMPLIIAAQFLLILSLAYLVAALNVSLRDTQYALPVLLQLGYYVTPIFYDAATVPEDYHLFLEINPMYHIISGYRALVVAGELPNLMSILYVVALSSAFLFMTRAYFIKASARFLEEL
jgi:ABC-type polysaccharide/polyol phosphate export permease